MQHRRLGPLKCEPFDGLKIGDRRLMTDRQGEGEREMNRGNKGVRRKDKDGGMCDKVTGCRQTTRPDRSHGEMSAKALDGGARRK